MSSFTSYLTRPIIIAFAGGLLTIIVVAYLLGFISLGSTSTHPIGTSHDGVVHVHADFRLYIGDERIRFTDEKYQSSTQMTHHPSLHFHDGNDEVIHRHADGVTLSDFFTSIGMKLTNDCLTMDTGATHCTGEDDTLMLMVNGTQVTDVTKYITQEEDQILLYFGDPKNPNLTSYEAGVTDLSCMYSGTCPERGTPPTESCGLTCEVADMANTQTNNWWHTIKDWFARE